MLLPLADTWLTPGPRSENFWDTVAIQLDNETPASVLEAMEASLKAHVATLPREFTGAAAVLARWVDGCGCMSMCT